MRMIKNTALGRTYLLGLLILSVGIFSGSNRVAAGENLAGIEKAGREWVEAYNQGGRVGDFYLTKAVYFPGRAASIRGSSKIDLYYQGQFKRYGKISEIRPSARYQVTPEVTYELGDFVLEKGGSLGYLTVWRYLNGQWNREIEASVERAGEPGDLTEISMVRKRWEELCAENDVPKLLKQLYEDQSVYYTRGNVFMGIANIATAYEYFNISGYEVKLQPLSVERPVEDLAYEIGEYIMANKRGQGLYMMIWRRDPAGVWRVLLDSNV